MDTKIYNTKGKEIGTITLPESVFNVPWNADLVHQVLVSIRSNARTPVAHVKDRSEVAGGGKKPWQQKGTGRARHGSIRSPIWVGGGVTHGPRNEKNYSQKINKKMKAKALYTLLSRKLRDGEILFVENFEFKEPKTSGARDVLKSFATIKGFKDILSKRKNSAYIALDNRNASIEKSFRNFGNVAIDEVRNINPADLLDYKYLIIENPEDSVKFIAGKLPTKKNPLKSIKGTSSKK